MRHGESQNNVIAKIFPHDIYIAQRTSDPELSQQGIEDCRMAGTRLSEMGIKFDVMLTSAHKRAILSLKNLRETYVHSDDTPC